MHTRLDTADSRIVSVESERYKEFAGTAEKAGAVSFEAVAYLDKATDS